MNKTIAVHVRYKSLYISFPFCAKQQRETDDQILCSLQNVDDEA